MWSFGSPIAYQTGLSKVLQANTAYFFEAFGMFTGKSKETLKVGVTKGAQTDQPLKTTGGFGYKVCTNPSCAEHTAQCQTIADNTCECDNWATNRHTKDWGISGNCCQQPVRDRKRLPWCLCKGNP